jgi:putative SOS response-associated peptidase YedK
MCNHYANDLKKLGRFLGDLIGEQFSETRIRPRFGNLAEHVYPDRLGLVIREGEDGAWEMDALRWGFPPPPNAGSYWVTNVRSTSSPFWARWLETEHRCLVPATAFAEYDQASPVGKKVERWFARTNGEPFFFAGIWRQYAGIRGTKKEPVKGEHQVFAFLTTDANSVVRPIHAKAMPVILGPEDAAIWLRAPVREALELQRPAPEDMLAVVEDAA